jgi:hypothetical protein
MKPANRIAGASTILGFSTVTLPCQNIFKKRNPSKPDFQGPCLKGNKRRIKRQISPVLGGRLAFMAQVLYY